MDRKRKNKGTIFIVLIILGALAFQMYEVDEPWVGIKDYNGAIYGIMARNFVKHGYLRTRFGQAMNTGPVHENEFLYYLHHPPIFYFLVSFSYYLFGVHEWSARLVPILFSLLSLFFFFKLIRKVWGVEEAYYSTFFLAFLPMNLYFSRIVLQESSITLGIALIFWYYVKWREDRRPACYWRIVAVFVFFGLIDWPAYYLLPLLTLHTLIVDRGKESPGRRRIVLLPFFGVLLFSVFVAYCSLLTRYQQGAGLLDAFIFRSAVKTEFLDYSFFDFIRLEAARGYHLFTPFVPVLSVVWLLYSLSGEKRHDLERNLLVVLFVLFGAIHVFLWKDASWIHEFWMFHLCAGLALSAGLAVVWMRRSALVKRRGVVRPILLYILPLCFLLYSAREVVLMHRVVEQRDLTVAGMILHEISAEEEKIIVHWEDPVPPAVGNYFRYYGMPIYNKPIPNVAYYADRNIRWGLKDLQDFRALLSRPGDGYKYFLTRVEYLRDAMDEEIRRYLLEQFDPLFMLDKKGDSVDPDTLTLYLRGEEIGVKNGLIVFMRKSLEASG